MNYLSNVCFEFELAMRNFASFASSASVVMSNIYKIKANHLDYGYDALLTVTKLTDLIYVNPGISKYKRVRFHEPGFLCLLYSKSEVFWENGNNKGVLRHGEIAVFDCKQPILYTLVQVDSMYVIFIPRCIYDEVTINEIIKSNSFSYLDYIVRIFENLKNKDNEIMLKNNILSIVNLLSVTEEKVLPIKIVSLFDEIVKIIHTHALDSLFSLDKAAALSFCSKRKLHNCLFDQGTSYSKLIHEYRVNHLAEQLLIDKASRVDTLCYKSGFNSASYAIKKFKSVKGMTPMQYRSALL